MGMERITSRQNPLVARLRKLGNDKKTRRQEGVFLCEGHKLVEEALRWNAVVETLVVAEGIEPPRELPEGVRLVEVPADVLKSVSTVDTPQGMLAVCRTPDLTPPKTLTPGLYLVLDGVQDPGNVGTVWRTADAFGAEGVFLLPGCAEPFSPKTVRSTMGACFRLPVWETGLEELTVLLKTAELPLYATALREDTADLRAADLSRAAVVIGSEGRGVSQAVLDACALTLKIPMRDRCESLNAAVAASVVLWEGWRNR
ncbi:TrmH family RNA methyltransferase [Flavonifractor sp. An112]|uniref:TrmH family RNA methyltransferase n=1 Tax=Flavonifractor sp. An112 TaxID=1965544 RepID=UPI001FA930D0|nr:RNA methyltransferase [Flavonifractor sp. An112]